MNASLVFVAVTACNFNVWLMDHVILNFNDDMSTAGVFLDIEKAFDITGHIFSLALQPQFVPWPTSMKLFTSLSDFYTVGSR
jgi:hypothetical protein